MRKKLFSILLLFFTVLFLVSCSSNLNFDSGKDTDTNESGGSGDENSFIVTDTNRKIIYTARVNLKTKKLSTTVTEIKALLQPGDWIQNQEITSDSNYLQIRIKTTRLETFLNNLQNNYETTYFKLESNDVSTQYVDRTKRIDALDKEYDRLTDMYATASIENMMSINRRLSEIESELLYLNQQLIELDSLIEYSTVYLYVYGPKASPTPPSYGKTLKDSFMNGWNGVLFVLKGILQIFVTLIPFAVVIGIPAGGIIFGVNKYSKHKKNKKEKKDNED